jgi:hypothetical protein
MDISVQALRMFLELKKYHTKPNGTFLVKIFILNFSICCSSSSFSFFILTCVHCKTARWGVEKECKNTYINEFIQIKKMEQDLNAWRHYCSALKAMWQYREMWLDLTLKTWSEGGEVGEEGDANDDGLVVVEELIQQGSEALPLFTIHNNNST